MRNRLEMESGFEITQGGAGVGPGIDAYLF